MPSLDINHSREMMVFTHVVEQGSFSGAARRCRMTPSAVSKLIARLETRLGAKLVNRSTRRFQLTSEGLAFYEQATRILADIRDAERRAGAGERSCGRVRLTTSASYAVHVLAPILPDFFDLYPEITMDIVQTDAVIDLLPEQTDVAVRAGPLKNSGLIARKLGETGSVIAAAPRYLERFGIPETPADLEKHRRLGFGYVRAVDGWPMRHEGATCLYPVSGNIQVSDGEALRRFALSGNGLARMALFTVCDDIADGRLVPVLEAFNPGDQETFYAVHVGGSGPLLSRIRVLLDFLGTRGCLK